MAKNDKVLLDGIIDDRIENNVPSSNRDEVFEYLAFEQILKDLDLSGEEIEWGWTDGRNDGGIDGFYIFVNGHLLSDLESFSWPRSGSELEVWIITCKHEDTFKQGPLDKLVASLTELFNFELERDSLKGDYSNRILKFRENLKLAYRKLSPRLNKFAINFSYASRGDASKIGEAVISRSEQIKSIANDSFGSSEATFTFYGSAELVELHRKMPNYSLELPFVEALSRGERYVLLAKLKDYNQFITEEGKLRKYLLDSNVRDYMGLNRVNEDIKKTLNNDGSPDFWWLNNGITILATSASVIGKCIKLEDIQIVNGLQTTESIFRYFKDGGGDPGERAVLVKIIVSNEEAVSDSIIKATNNQTDVELSSLHATDKIQRDIEDVLVRNGLYYERRKNFYVNLGHSPTEIITPLYLASGFVSLILKAPYQASVLKSKFMRSKISYNKIFSENAPINVWPKIAFLLKKTDEILEKLRPGSGEGNQKFLKKWRHLTCFLAVSKIIGKFDFAANELAELDVSVFTDEEIEAAWRFARQLSPNLGKGISFRKHGIVIRICKAAANEFGISGIKRIEKRAGLSNSTKKRKRKIDLEFANKVDDLLPSQPWKPGVHEKVINELQCTKKEYDGAVKLLIEDGRRNFQKDGVVYDTEGNVLSFDPERVDSNSIKPN